MTVAAATWTGSSRPAVWAEYPRLSVVYGLPVLLWAVVLLAPSLASACVVAIIGVQLAYLLLRPTAERAVWTLLSYLFSVGGAPLILYGATFAALPGWIAWLSYLIIPLAAVPALLMRRRWRGRVVLFATASLLVISCVSSLVHGSQMSDLIGWWLHFLRYPLLFLALVSSRLHPRQYQNLLGAFVLLSVLQIPATVIQFVWGSLSGAWAEDHTVGTMFGAQTGLMGLTVVSAFFAVLSHALVAKWSLSTVLLCFLLWVPLVVGGSGFPLFIGMLLTSYILIRWGFSFRWLAHGAAFLMQRKLLIFAILGGMVAGTLLVALFVLSSDDPEGIAGRFELTDWISGRTPTLTSLEAFTNPRFAASESRQRFIATTFEWFAKYPDDLWLGALGPRAALGQSVSTLSALTGGQADSPLAQLNEGAGLPSQATQFVIGLPRTLLEVGLAGLLAFGWLFWVAWQIGGGAARTCAHNTWVRGQALAFEAIWLLYVVLSILYLDAWRVDQTSFAFWLWAAMLASARNSASVEVTPVETTTAGWPRLMAGDGPRVGRALT